jgi:hypothetical protein
MSGIAKIKAQYDDFRSGGTTFAPGKEVWLKDGDQVFLSSVATGEELDTNLEAFYMYTFRKDNRWTNVLSHPDVDQSEVPDDCRPSHKFAFWAYVHEIMHDEKRNDEWEEVQQEGTTRKMFKETVNDFRVMALGFGRGGYVWQQVEDIYFDWDNRLDKGVIRIKRVGAGAMDTAYTITTTARKLEIPESKVAEIDELESINEYLMTRYGGETQQSTSNEATKVGGLGDLF